MQDAPNRRATEIAAIFRKKNREGHVYAFVLGLFSSPHSPVFIFTKGESSEEMSRKIANLVCTLSEGYSSPYLCDSDLVQDELEEIVADNTVSESGSQWISTPGVELVADKVAELAERALPTY